MITIHDLETILERTAAKRRWSINFATNEKKILFILF